MKTQIKKRTEETSLLSEQQEQKLNHADLDSGEKPQHHTVPSTTIKKTTLTDFRSCPQTCVLVHPCRIPPQYPIIPVCGLEISNSNGRRADCECFRRRLATTRASYSQHRTPTYTTYFIPCSHARCLPSTLDPTRWPSQVLPLPATIRQGFSFKRLRPETFTNNSHSDKITT